jgi:hypothetical protein
MPKKGTTPQLTVDQADRYRQVVQLRTAGYTFDRIASQLGYSSRSGAKEAYDSALKRWGRATVDEHRDLEGERVEELWRRTFRRLSQLPDDADSEEFVRLVLSAVRVAKRKADLFGLDAPRQVEVAGAGGGPIQTDVGELLRDRLKALEA